VVSRDRTHLGRTTRRANLREEVNIDLVVVRPFARKIVFVIDGLDWTHRLTGAAVNTFIRVDVEHPVTLVNAVNWTLINTCLVFDVYTRERDNVSHRIS
jgi:hypothetical protein